MCHGDRGSRCIAEPTEGVPTILFAGPVTMGTAQAGPPEPRGRSSVWSDTQTMPLSTTPVRHRTALGSRQYLLI